jgi:hypothetical protein
MAAEGLIAFDELRAKLAGLEETRETAERELAAVKGQRESIERMERDKDAVLEHYAPLAPEAWTPSPLSSAMVSTRYSGWSLLHAPTGGWRCTGVGDPRWCRCLQNKKR